MTKRAFITGIGGQDGWYLAQILNEKGYEVHGLTRRPLDDEVIGDGVPASDRLAAHLHFGDLTDSSNIARLVREIAPDEVYNLGAQSRVAASFHAPLYTASVDGLGTLRVLEAIRLSGLVDRTRFYQASTAELFGKVSQSPQSETTPFYPRSPYAAAKLFSYWTTVNYREAYGMFACNGVLFNHDSPRRGKEFVTRKITSGMARISVGLQRSLSLGNLDAKRDWGHAADYVRMQWLMLQRDAPADYVIATGEQHSVRDFVTWAAAALGIEIRFFGSGVDEHGIAAHVVGEAAAHVKQGDILIRVDPRFFRPTDVVDLVGDPGRALNELGWSPLVTARDMCAEMVASDLAVARRDARHIPSEG
ncbi:GDP-mannose 4,6-dehydratase [Sphingomonas sp. BK235]|uniref:GDP-mannose 4,6-dehydratase n=1 Tax=Sphingomonas sp. BK235 TaxID=2512131 RepID=UPI00104A280F|nr:GDP-mannose 4,6-dehydratase [Sphingomonas sp. BK235]TCP29373.1 GDPmannose 4,6-dehydratase [Sphingomonas sp. BK235]